MHNTRSQILSCLFESRIIINKYLFHFGKEAMGLQFIMK